jgi:hypothetical protein
VSKGFGAPPQKRSASTGSAKRAEAAKKFDKMRAKGNPDFQIFIRIQGQKNWIPVGEIAVQRSNLISYAIFDNEDQLVQAAYRLSPPLRKYEGQFEFGYRLKEFRDEPIQKAERPNRLVPNVLQRSWAQVQQMLGSLFRPKSK